MPMDGELWLGHGKFDTLSGAVFKDVPVDAEWAGISYLVFELPGAIGLFEVRAETIRKIIDQADIPHLKAVARTHVKDEAALGTLLKQVVQKGGEGLILHCADALYMTGRSDVLLKLKPLFDAEATILGYTPGRGKYKGKLGSLIVVTPEGLRFKIGTGFSDAQRENPPKIGITYTFNGKTKTVNQNLLVFYGSGMNRCQ